MSQDVGKTQMSDGTSSTVIYIHNNFHSMMFSCHIVSTSFIYVTVVISLIRIDVKKRYENIHFSILTFHTTKFEDLDVFYLCKKIIVIQVTA